MTISRWRRLRRDVLWVIGFLLVLEVVVRVDPVRSLLTSKLDVYENLLWYSEVMPAYQDQLTNGPHYDLWIIGSSYMMTGLNPASVQEVVQTSGFEELTVQNYGMSLMRNLADMAEVYERWMFRMNQPRYIVLALSQQNFVGGAFQPATARTSPMESTYIFPDSIDDYAAGFLFRTSALYRYTILARNATYIPYEEAVREPRPLGGYIEDPLEFKDCDSSSWVPEDQPPSVLNPAAVERFDRLVKVIRDHDIPLLIVNVPIAYCGLRLSYANFESYEQSYLTPLAAHIESLGLPFMPLDYAFYAEVPEADQNSYFENTGHPNFRGAAILSRITGEFIAAWLDDAGLR